MAEMTAAQVKSKRTVYLTLSTVTLLLLGLLYAFSMFAAPMCQTFGLEKTDIALTFNIMMIAFCLGCVAGSFIEKATGTRGSLICSGVLFLIGFAGTGFFGYDNLLAVYGLYGICGGAGVGIGYNTIVATTNVWFPDKVGFSSGILMMGFGVSALLLGNLSLKFIPMVGLTTVFIALGVVVFAIAFGYSFILKRPPANIVEIMTGRKIGAAASDPADNDFPLKSSTFYVFWGWAIVVIAIGLATIGNAASDAQLVGFDASFATLLVGFVSTSNGLSRIIMGAVYDRTNVKITMTIDAVIAVVAAGSIFLAFQTGIGALYVLGALSCGFCYGAIPVVSSAFARQRFGAKNYPQNLSLVNLSIIFGSLLNIVIGSVVGVTNRPEIFMVLVVLSLIALVDTFPFAKKWDKDIAELETKRAAIQEA